MLLHRPVKQKLPLDRQTADSNDKWLFCSALGKRTRAWLTGFLMVKFARHLAISARRFGRCDLDPFG